MRYLGWVGVLIFVGLLVSSCGQASGGLGSAVPSKVEGLLIPSNATPIHQTSSHFSTYAAPKGITVAALTQWERGHLPIGRTWKGWVPCRTTIGSRAIPTTDGEAWTWKRDDLVLLVGTGEEDRGQRALVTLFAFPPRLAGVSCK
jgi:hypothetical protein